MAFNSQGVPLAGETVNMSFEVRGENFMMTSSAQTAKVNPDGSFSFPTLRPTVSPQHPYGCDPERPAEAANVIVSVAGGDVEGVNITTGAAGAVVGRVVVDGSAPLPTPLSKLVVRPLPVDRDTSVNMLGIPDNGRLRDDGSFELKSVVGLVRFTVAPLSDGWAIRQIEHNSRDLTSQPVDTMGQTLEGMTIRQPIDSLSCRAACRTGKGKRFLPGPRSCSPTTLRCGRRICVRFAPRGSISPGCLRSRAYAAASYLIVAVDTVTNNQWNDPEYLESLRQHGTRLTLAEGDAKRVELVVKSVAAQ